LRGKQSRGVKIKIRKRSNNHKKISKKILNGDYHGFWPQKISSKTGQKSIQIKKTKGLSKVNLKYKKRTIAPLKIIKK